MLAPVTVRGLYYQAVISSALPFITKDKGGARTNYRMIQSRVLELRQSGAIPWGCIVDPSRSDYGQPRWLDPAGFAETAPLYFSLDCWRDQEIRPLLMVEKAGQVPVYRQHAARHGVDVVACKGYGSATYLKDTAEKISSWIDSGQMVQVIVAADFDPSGCDWPRAAQAEIERHLEQDAVIWRRELVRIEDLARMGDAVALRAPNPQDTRTRAFLTRHGFTPDLEVCVEMDAIDPVTARSRLEQVYLDLFDGDLAIQQQLERDHREAITTALSGLTG
ncbi:hypothetical protein MITS9509_00996 [Synechococcus sp. MIT S9509]|uniref:hypothetical protein n=1 Tax=Synechococcus sp. MIT S9509 TaxID=1801630 RepID=UPI0007BBBBBF|nr:hypothetical protein [Synechococcus sp. MIT S9509]KZR93119.1 hypothetical protein MITS9509_00996 [Synechococcus sp. MIT S9509]